MCGGASKPSRLRMVGPTFARPAWGKSTLKRALSGRPGPPIATGTCAPAQTGCETRRQMHLQAPKRTTNNVAPKS